MESNKTTLYHGTNKDFDKFSLAHSGQNTDWDNCHNGIFLTEEIGIAQLFGNNVLQCDVNLNKPLNLCEVFSYQHQAVDITSIIFEEDIPDPAEALEFIDENIGLGEYLEFMEAFNSADTINEFKTRGYDHIISNFSREKIEYCVFDPANIAITHKNIISRFPPSAYLSVLPANAAKIQNIIKALDSKDESRLNLLYKQLHKNLDSIPNKIDGIEIDNFQKLRILAGKDRMSGYLSYSVHKGKLYRELPDSLSTKSPVLKLSADKVKKQRLRIR
ncbi:MAG: hypothetical protein LBF27_05860 [Sphingobacterium sp.]|jgi:hypothetical protein|nr:hypothetical protein [Sphingobacterium sp.]